MPLRFLVIDCRLIFSFPQLVEFEKENNNIVTFTVPSRAVSRILGQKGSKVNEIAADSGAHIDVAKDDSDTATITLRGTKKACAAAKVAILAIADSVEDEVLVTIKVEPKFHRTIIGGGGVGLKNLLARVGGPTDPREQAGLVRLYVCQSKLSYPRNDINDLSSPQPPNDEVIIRGEKNLVKKVAVELERVVTNLRERVVLGVIIPNQHHKSLIGHGGQPLTELEKKTGAEVQFPGSRSYHQVTTPSNLEELGDVEEKDIVKVAGSKSACEKAIVELQVRLIIILVHLR
jgi:predicted PilT family ATPase